MPIYMDVHIVPGVKARNVAEAHLKDLQHQEEFACNCMTYWIDEERESIFCLIEAPDKKAVEEMHGKSHGLIPGKIIEVSSSLVESFLGRIYDPSEVQLTEDGLKVFSDPSFRVLLVTKTTDPVLLQHTYGVETANELLQQQHRIIRRVLTQHGGREVECGGTGFVISFASAADAVACALEIHKDIPSTHSDISGLRMAINAGEPVGKTNSLFGDATQLAGYLCEITSCNQVAISSSVKELIAKDALQHKTNHFFSLSPADESSLELLFSKLEENFQDNEFDVPEYCQVMAMSNSQLYRKCMALTGISPNILLKDFRLKKAKDLLKKKHYTISQITFDSGFSSPSYFTKCFKKKYDLLPMAYIDLLQ
ncbi:MAG: nickel-binding protein [Ferruginibacter sp.]